MQHNKMGPRAEYRQQENLRINASPNIGEKFQGLKSLTVDLVYYEANETHKTGQLKYSVNLANAKSAFSFVCPNSYCVGGDFDLSQELADAVTDGEEIVSGKVRCEGWQSKTTIDSVKCGNILRYTFSLAY
jgi:hypothetical protein